MRLARRSAAVAAATLLAILLASHSAAGQGVVAQCAAVSNGQRWAILYGGASNEACVALARQCTGNPNVAVEHYPMGPKLILPPFTTCSELLRRERMQPPRGPDTQASAPNEPSTPPQMPAPPRYDPRTWRHPLDMNHDAEVGYTEYNAVRVHGKPPGTRTRAEGLSRPSQHVISPDMIRAANVAVPIMAMCESLVSYQDCNEGCRISGEGFRLDSTCNRECVCACREVRGDRMASPFVCEDEPNYGKFN